MEQLRSLHRKSSILGALKCASCTGSLSEGDRSLLAETLLVLSDHFGEQLAERLRVLAVAAPELQADESLLGQLNAVAAPPHKAARLDDAPPPAVSPQPERAVVTMESLELAQSSLEDFVRSYFPFHGLDAGSPADVFRHLPVLAFMEAHIYGLDQANEEVLLPGRQGNTVGSDGFPVPLAEPFEPLRAVLKERDLLTAEIEAEFREGARFWALERKLSGALADPDKAADLNISDVKETLRLKSFDYRVMNLLLYAMRRQAPDKDAMAFLAASEMLVELGDDLVDYEDDVRSNSFNTYRCFLALYGHEQGPSELKGFIAEMEARYAGGLEQLPAELADAWRSRCAAQSRHGSGSERGPGGGCWELPAPLDEADVRASCR